MTLSVIVEIVCRDTSAPYTSARCACDLPGGQALGGQRDDHVVDPGQAAAAACATICGSKRAVAVAGHVDLDRADLGQHRLGAGAVAGVAAVLPGRVVLVIAEVVGDLALQRGLQHPLRQLLQQPALAGQLQPTRTGPGGEPVDQLLVDRVQRVRCWPLFVNLGRVPSRQVRHRCHLQDQELHRSSYSPHRELPEAAAAVTVASGSVRPMMGLDRPEPRRSNRP